MVIIKIPFNKITYQNKETQQPKRWRPHNVSAPSLFKMRSFNTNNLFNTEIFYFCNILFNIVFNNDMLVLMSRFIDFTWTRFLMFLCLEATTYNNKKSPFFDFVAVWWEKLIIIIFRILRGFLLDVSGKGDILQIYHDMLCWLYSHKKCLS